MNSLEFVGLVCFVAGLATETVADEQNKAFSLMEVGTPGKLHPFITKGLWAYSRNPNYFGEILLWLGLWLFASQSLWPLAILCTAASPSFIAFLLICVSGIPMVDKAAEKRYGLDPHFRRYVECTSLLVPWPRSADVDHSKDN
jgi:steroid 5-alpha reductase family enzyme